MLSMWGLKEKNQASGRRKNRNFKVNLLILHYKLHGKKGLLPMNLLTSNVESWNQTQGNRGESQVK